MVHDLKTAQGLLAYAAQIEEQARRIRAYPGCDDRKKRS